MKFEIINHLLYLDGKQVAFKKSPNISSYKNKLQYLVEHYTATYGSSSPINWLTDKESQVSAHLVVDKEGVVTQLVPFDEVAWHAGVSKWKGLDGMNQYAIGIEIVNSGILTHKSDGYYSPDGHKVENYKELTNKLGLKAVWELYPDKQIEAVASLSKVLVDHYSLKEIVGHEDIAPGRKTDPGPAFPWDRIRGQASTNPSKIVTTNLNLRSAASTTASIVKVLQKGEIVYPQKSEGDWSFLGNGWVATRYLS